jgi:hypothetical protein
VRDGHQQFSPLHMLKVLLDDSEGLAGGLIDRADRTERLLAQRFNLLERQAEIRRFDVLAGDIADVAASEARSRGHLCRVTS